MEQMFNIPAIKYILRSTGEEVEVIDFENKERGDRTEFDWVSYIDSKGKEHIKEKLNIQFDFKPQSTDIFQKVFNAPVFKGMATERNRRIFEVAKELYLSGDKYSINEAVEVATNLVDKVGIEFEEK
jgi:hypothetical protein